MSKKLGLGLGLCVVLLSLQLVSPLPVTSKADLSSNSGNERRTDNLGYVAGKLYKLFESLSIYMFFTPPNPTHPRTRMFIQGES